MSPKTGQSTKSRTLRIALLILLIAAAGVAGYAFLFEGEKAPNILTLYGNVDVRQAQLAFPVSGRIVEIHVTEGDRVEEGRLLAEIDASYYRPVVARARAQVAAQEQVLAELLAGSREEEIAAARARVNEAEARLGDARQSYQRTQELAETQYATEQKLDSARAALKQAEARLRAAQQDLELVLKGPRTEAIHGARARLDSRKAALELAEEKLEDTRLHAPGTGIVRNRILEPGDMAFPQKPALTLALTDPLWIRAYVDETNLGKIAPGMKAEVTTDSFPEKIYRGWIGYISPTAEFTPKTVQTEELRSKLVYQVRVFVCNPEYQLRLGMPVTVTVPLDQPKAPDDIPGDPCGEQEQ